MMATPASQVRRFADLDSLSRAAADEFTAIAQAAIAARGVFHVALSGGSTPKRLFTLLAQRGPAALPWDRIELWWGDERTVPPDHADSNYRMTREALIEPLGLAASRVHRIAAETDPAAAAADYERQLVDALGAPPIFDLVLLGMGSDGHTASLFPESPGLDETARWVIANPVDSPLTHGPATRITLTAPAINAARHIRFLVAGSDKATSLAQVLEGPNNPKRYPSQLIARRGGDVAWLVDTAAAAALGGAS
jgi:6-phosphogluconolactonase